MGIRDYNGVNWNDVVYYDTSSPTYLRWKIEKWTGKDYKIPRVKCGDIAGTVSSTGVHLGHDKKVYLLHRVIWVLFNGSIDDNKVIDHIDGNPLNNDISNLRLVYFNVNARNKSTNSRNTTGVTGVHYEITTDRYRATWVDGSGSLRTKSFAVSVYKDKAFLLACEYRTKMIRELNMLGAGYTERHAGPL